MDVATADRAALLEAARAPRDTRDYSPRLAAWKALTALEPTPNGSDMGIVTSVTHGSIRGYLADGLENRTVEIRLNGRTVATATACQPRKDGPATAFTAKLKRLWRYVGKGDVLTLTVDDKPLHIEGSGDRVNVYSRRRSRHRRLFARLDAGTVFNKHGKLQKSLKGANNYTPHVMTLFAEVADRVKERFGYDVFVIYGTLLGCIREGNFIAHDDDIDVVYVSRFSTPQEVRDEFLNLCRFLISEGFDLSAKRFGTKVRRPGDRYRKSLGLHFGWLDPDGAFNVAYGHHGDQYQVPGELTFTDATLGAFSVRVPQDSETILAMLYGPGWRVPDPGFRHHGGTKKSRTEFWLSPEELATLPTRRGPKPESGGALD